MPSKIRSKRSWFSLGAAALALFFVIIFFYTYLANSALPADQPSPLNPAASQSSEPIPAATSSEQTAAGLPLRLKIPGINVDAAVEPVGLTPQGAMDVPKNQKDVAWFELGQRPGESGSAVMAGHYGWKDRQASAFDNLYKLRPGDKLYIEDDQGATISFVVRAARRYGPKADASAVFGSNDGKAHLNLITCEGVWDKISQSYSQRLVIFTDRE